MDVEDVAGGAVGLLARAGLAAVRRFPPSWVQGGARALFSKSWRVFVGACQDPRLAQETHLRALLAQNANTAFGREHGYASLKGYEDFAARVPVRTWDGFAPYVRRMLAGEKDILTSEEVFFYARSSGTTGEPKSIPITAGYLEEFRHGRRIWLRQVAQVMPRAIRGHVLTVHSPAIEGHSAGGTPYGSITVPMGGGREDVTGFDPVPRAVFKLKDFRSRYYLALRFALQRPVTVMAAVNPSTLVLLCQVLQDRADDLIADLEGGGMHQALLLDDATRALVLPRLHADKAAARRIRESREKHGVVRPVDVWPGMAGLLCWKGGSAPFYLKQLEALAPGLPIMDYGFAASEGMFAVPLDAGEAQGVALAAGHVLEFVPWEPYEQGSRAALPMWELKQGQRYVLLVTGAHGLARYDMQDVVEVTGFRGNAPMLRFLHKAGNMVSITGEKLAESHVVDAVTRACREKSLTLRGFAVAPELSHPPRYVFAVEPQAPLSAQEAEALRHACDVELQTENLEYRAKRESLRLGDPMLRQLPLGAFERHRARRVASGAPDAHVKPPHLMRELKTLDELGTPTLP